jgi:hypothetical protein
VINYRTAKAIGVAPQASPQIVAEYLCRQAGIGSIATLSPGSAEWFVFLASLLGEHLPYRADCDPLWSDVPAPMPGDEVARSVAEVAMERLRAVQAPSALAAIAPDLLVGGCPAGQLERACRAQVGRHLETFCRRVLETWRQEGYIRDEAV